MQLEELIPFDLDVLDAVKFAINFDVCTRFVVMPVFSSRLGYSTVEYDRNTGLITIDGEDITYLKEYLQ